MTAELPFLMRTYAAPRIGFVRGRGAWLYDRRGRAWLDFISGLGVNLLGHCPPALVSAIQRQAGRLIHSSNLYRIEPQVRLARRLCEASFADRVFFCNSGAEANDTLIKIARYYFHKRGQSRRHKIVAFEGGFHGRTYGALSVTSRPSAREGFEPVVPGVCFAPFNDAAAAAKAIDKETCLVLIEPILGEGGIVPADRRFLGDLRRLCDRAGALLAFDEAQTGLGRTGHAFAYRHYAIEPDLMALGKGLAGGLPMAAVLAREPFASALEPGTHGSTFGGNPLSSAAALVVTARVFRPAFLERATDRGRYLLERLDRTIGRNALVRSIRGLGLMIGIELNEPGSVYVDRCGDHGLLINCTAENVLRLLPPLIVSKGQCDLAVDVIASALRTPSPTH